MDQIWLFSSRSSTTGTEQDVKRWLLVRTPGLLVGIEEWTRLAVVVEVSDDY